MTQRTISNGHILVAVIIVHVIGISVLMAAFFIKGVTVTTVPPGGPLAESALQLGDALYAQELYQQAVDQYSRVLATYDLPAEQAANLAYRTGEIYFERLGHYPEALAAFLTAEHHDRDGTLSQSINQKKVACLERMKRSRDARRVLEEKTLLDDTAVKTTDASAPVAEVGGKAITLRQFEEFLDGLPAEEKKMAETREGKLALLQNFVAIELIVNAARRQGLDRDRKVVDLVSRFEKNILAQAYVSSELGENLTMTPSDVRLYYEANKQKYEDKPFEEVQEKVLGDFQQQKYQEAISIMFERLSKADNVVLHPQNIED